MTDSRLSINNLCVDYPESRVVNNVSFTLGNERLALVGAVSYTHLTLPTN